MTTALAKDYLKLLESGDFADVRITCQGRVWKVHSAILVGRSTWFKKALSGGWKETQRREINIDNVHPGLMDILINYIYTDELPLLEEHVRPHLLLEYNVKLFIQADFFLLSRLKDQTLKHLQEMFCLDTIDFFRHKVTTFDGDCQYTAAPEASWSTDEAKKILSDLCKAVRLAYSVLTARDLHKTVTAFTLCLRSQINAATLKRLFKDVPAFQADVNKVTLALLFNNDFGDQMALRNLEERAKVFVESEAVQCSWCEGSLTLDTTFFVCPLPNSGFMWCEDCAQKGYTNLTEKLIEALPID